MPDLDSTVPAPRTPDGCAAPAAKRATWRSAASRIAARAAAVLAPASAPQVDHRNGGIDKPSWRGRQHAYAFLAAVPAAGALVAIAPPGRRWPVAVYSASLLTTLGVSAAYHTLAASPASQHAMSRADRATIYALIAGTATPVLAYTASPRSRALVLTGAWAAAALGAGMRAAGIANKTATAGYVALGWAGAIATRNAWAASPTACVLLAAGGTAYTAGAVMYATRRPALAPATYGYHEAFHTLTLVGFATHYAAVAVLAAKARTAPPAALAT